MKTFVSLLLASVFIGFVVFAVFYWLVNYRFQDACIIGVSSALAGLSAEYVRRYLEQKKENRIAS